MESDKQGEKRVPEVAYEDGSKRKGQGGVLRGFKDTPIYGRGEPPHLKPKPGVVHSRNTRARTLSTSPHQTPAQRWVEPAAKDTGTL